MTQDLVATKTDANLSVTTYTYDPYGRATTIARARQGQAPDPCQSTHYLYDVNPNHPNTANAWGRLAASYTGDLDGSGLPLCTVQTLNGVPTNQVFVEDYTYTAAGLMNGKSMQMRKVQGAGPVQVRSWTEAVTYDAFGSPVTVKYPDQDNGDGTAILNRTVTYDYNALGQVGAYRWDALTGDSRVPVDNNAINGTSYNAAPEEPRFTTRQPRPMERQARPLPG